MAPNELVKVIDLDQSSTEYHNVKSDFKKTVKQTVLKVTSFIFTLHYMVTLYNKDVFDEQAL